MDNFIIQIGVDGTSESESEDSKLDVEYRAWGKICCQSKQADCIN